MKPQPQIINTDQLNAGLKEAQLNLLLLKTVCGKVRSLYYQLRNPEGDNFDPSEPGQMSILLGGISRATGLIKNEESRIAFYKKILENNRESLIEMTDEEAVKYFKLRKESQNVPIFLGVKKEEIDPEKVFQKKELNL